MPKIGLIQTSCSEFPEENLSKTVILIEQCITKGAQIVCLQELFNTTYFCREIDQKFFKWAQSIPGPVTDTLSQIAEKHEIVILVPIFEKKAPGVYFNSMAVIDADGTLMGTYRKMHIPDDPGFYEKYYFTPGDNGYQVYKTRYGNIGTLICWDQWYPEAARITALKGADILVYPTAIAVLPDENEEERRKFHDAWRTIQRSHAIANGCFVASINRVGEEGGSVFWGGSFIAGPFGEVLAEADDKEAVIVQDVDFSIIDEQRQVWPFFRDRRIESYDSILKRFE